MKHHFKSLQDWQFSRTFISKVYQGIAALPRMERFDLVKQMRRCAVSTNSIAEESKINIDKDAAYFHMSTEWDYPKMKTVELLIKDIADVQKMIIGLIDSLKSNADVK